MNQSPYSAGISVDRLAEMMTGAIASTGWMPGSPSAPMTCPVAGSMDTCSQPFHRIVRSPEYYRPISRGQPKGILGWTPHPDPHRLQGIAGTGYG
ncbi:hypothetical protein ASZ90_015858 [hydrocarbon metagenome]|uniref:Uncharacterized protein n=1 Tax=hydrocarbon metagenome TaxID=938273 RepID=A0A0W8F1M7_9ZZZZ